ncbi:hypothetical protein CRE_31353 [Caenorhabditis remanei]|uniref:Uncharacterized protein n=1 Tax=Caenorhabditis remanei TaxID=31234 RepID=E3MY60_CAERE|nr:hypothetical protein CRE_31353 [Caenorhabditis remanei]
MDEADEKFNVLEFAYNATVYAACMRQEWKDTLVSCLVYNLILILAVLFFRKIAQFSMKRDYFYEIIAAFSFGVCHYTEELMFRAFGYYGMFPMVVVNQVIFQKLNRRHGENAMIVAEEFVTGRVGDEDCLAVLSLQFAGALFCSFFFIVTAQDVFLKTKPLGCLFKYTKPLPIVMLCDFLGGLALRVLLELFQGRIISIAVIYAFLFTIGHAAIGVPVAHSVLSVAKAPECWTMVYELLPNLCLHIFSTLSGWLFLPYACQIKTTLRSMWAQKFEKDEVKRIAREKAEKQEQDAKLKKALKAEQQAIDAENRRRNQELRSRNSRRK